MVLPNAGAGRIKGFGTPMSAKKTDLTLPLRLQFLATWLAVWCLYYWKAGRCGLTLGRPYRVLSYFPIIGAMAGLSASSFHCTGVTQS